MSVAAGLCFVTMIKIKTFWCVFEPEKIIYLRKRKAYSGVNDRSHVHTTLKFWINDFRKLRSWECFPCYTVFPRDMWSRTSTAQGGYSRLLGIFMPCDSFYFKGLSRLGELLFRSKYLAIGYFLSWKLFGVLNTGLTSCSNCVMHTLVAW